MYEYKMFRFLARNDLPAALKKINTLAVEGYRVISLERENEVNKSFLVLMERPADKSANTAYKVEDPKVKEVKDQMTKKAKQRQTKKPAIKK